MDEGFHLLAVIEDRLFPLLGSNTYERAIYHSLVRLTFAEGRETVTVALAELARIAGVNPSTAREVIRSLREREVIEASTSRSGFTIRMVHPAILAPEELRDEPEIDIELLDFTDRRYLPALLDRERYRCFYCLRNLTGDSVDVDHLVPQASRVDHTYRNVVAACFGCNVEKGSGPADDFLRSLYRDGRLSQSELSEKLTAVEDIGSGDLRPDPQIVQGL